MHTQIKDRIEQIINNLKELPSIPDVAGKVISMVNDPDVSFKAVAREISRDQAITTNVLKLCNSAYFNRGKEITSVERAVVTLGIKEVKDIVVLAATKTILDKSVMGYDLAQGELWKHGLAVAVLSKKICMMKNKKSIADIAFTGGIIHDVGKTILALYVQRTYKEIIDTVIAKQIPFQMAEKEVMGFDHQEIGEQILKKWSFPEVLINIVRYHHEPDMAPDKYKIITSVIHIANTICLMGGIGIGSDGLYHELNDTALKLLSFKNSELEGLYTDLPSIINDAETIK